QLFEVSHSTDSPPPPLLLLLLLLLLLSSSSSSSSSLLLSSSLIAQVADDEFRALVSSIALKASRLSCCRQASCSGVMESTATTLTEAPLRIRLCSWDSKTCSHFLCALTMLPADLALGDDDLAGVDVTNADGSDHLTHFGGAVHSVARVADQLLAPGDLRGQQPEVRWLPTGIKTYLRAKYHLSLRLDSHHLPILHHDLLDGLVQHIRPAEKSLTWQTLVEALQAVQWVEVWALSMHGQRLAVKLDPFYRIEARLIQGEGVASEVHDILTQTELRKNVPHWSLCGVDAFHGFGVFRVILCDKLKESLSLSGGDFIDFALLVHIAALNHFEVQAATRCHHYLSEIAAAMLTERKTH
ncbi:hypothetical protein F7725_022023, partial [Dissostichus mawsoni]